MEYLESQRLYLRKLHPLDAPNLFKLDSDPEVVRYVGGSPVVSIKQSQEAIRRVRQYYDRHPGFGIFAAVEKQSWAFVGWFALKHLDQTDEVEIGYRLLRAHWGRGLATEMGRRIVQHGFAALNLPKLVAVTQAGNEASQRVLRKLGLCYVGERFHYNQPVRYFERLNQ